MTTEKKIATAKALIKQCQAALPLLFSQSPSTAVPISSVVQIIVAAYLAHHCYPTISLRDILFCILYPTYLLLANHFVFAKNEIIRQRPKEHPYNVDAILVKFFSGADTKWFARYMFLAATVGLVLPLVSILSAPKDVANLALPHLYVLWCQIIGESVVMFNPHVHRFICVLIPIGFSIFRMNLLMDWFLGSLSLHNIASNDGEDVLAWHAWGLVLAGLNLAFWTYNLFVMLLLKVTPEYLKDELCESPQVRVIRLPFVGEPGEKND